MKQPNSRAFRVMRAARLAEKTATAKPARAATRPRVAKPVIAVGVDFSPGSRVALDRANHLARSTGSRLVAVHVVPGRTVMPTMPIPGPWKTTTGPGAPRDGEEALTAAIWVAESRLREEARAYEAHPLVSAGKPHLVLAAIAAARRASVLVVGVHKPKQRVKVLFLGTTAERVLRKAAAPVLLARTKDVRAYERILVPVDLDGLAPRVLQLVGSLFPKATYHVVNFLPKKRPGDGRVAEQQREREGALAEMCAEAGLVESRLHVDVSPWAPRRGILQKARAWHCDLIVMGTRARHGAERVLHGSVAEDVSRAAEIDVLAVPPAARGGSARGE